MHVWPDETRRCANTTIMATQHNVAVHSHIRQYRQQPRKHSVTIIAQACKHHCHSHATLSVLTTMQRHPHTAHNYAATIIVSPHDAPGRTTCRGP
jgi:hypothetical protein